MLSDSDLDRHLSALKTPLAGRALVRKIREGGPVRTLKGRMDGVRVRHISKKMDGRALYAESRTVEFPGIYVREFDPQTIEIWPQPCQIDLTLQGPKGVTRLQHTPDLFLVRENGLLIEEWRTEKRLSRYAAERPDYFYKDESGRWHYRPIEEYLDPLGIEYHLRSADEHPETFISNLHMLEDFTLESSPPLPVKERQHLQDLLREHKRIEHTRLIDELGFKAEHVFQAVLEKAVFVDLYETPLRDFQGLVIYSSESIARAEALLYKDIETPRQVVSSALALVPGARFTYDGISYEILIVGTSEITVKNEAGQATRLPTSLVRELFEDKQIKQKAGANLAPLPGSVDKEGILNTRGLSKAVAKLSALNAPESPHGMSLRTLQRARSQIKGLTFAQDQLLALAPNYTGNPTQRLPSEVIEVATKVISTWHNKPECPTVQATFDRFVNECAIESIKPMARSMFYEFIKRLSNVRAREGKRQAYQQAPIEDYHDYGHPVHGVLPHEVCYCDHTIMNIFLRGMHDKNLGKPTLTIMVDGALSKPRAFFLSFQPASVQTVMMCLRDYVRRHGRLPRVLVLDNGKEFHSTALQVFCDIFQIKIRWRRRSRPRDSTIVERAIGATETEVIAQLKGNSIALKDPRLVSSSHNPFKHIEWTLTALHGALQHYLFEIHPQRVHPRFGVSPNVKEDEINLYAGTRGHLMVKYDELFKLLTAPDPGTPTRKLDPIRGIFVDGVYHWSKEFISLKPGTELQVRVEPWNAEVIYVEVNNQWIVARARGVGVLRGRHRYELDIQIREERRRRKAEALKDKSSIEGVKKKTEMWAPQVWDPRLREQIVEAYSLYQSLGMTEVLAEGFNEFALRVESELPTGTRSELIYIDGDGVLLPIYAEPDPPSKAISPTDEQPRTEATLAISESPVEQEPDDFDFFP